MGRCEQRDTGRETKLRRRITPRIEYLESRVVLDIGWDCMIVVNTEADSNVQGDEFISLREAIRLANGDLTRDDFGGIEQAFIIGSPTNGSRDTIGFRIADDFCEIRPLTNLPRLVDQVRIIGGASPVWAGFPDGYQEQSIQLSGANVGAGEIKKGLVIASSKSQIRELAIVQWTVGIEIESGSDNIIDGNTIGIDQKGAKSTNATGVLIRADANVNYIGVTNSDGMGGVVPGGNVISGNSIGIRIESSSNVVYYNKIGVNEDGESANLGNLTGIIVTGGSASQNSIYDNTIADNTNYGIRILNSPVGANRIYGNYIGIDEEGTRAPNGDGIHIFGSNGNAIGVFASKDGDLEGARNVISGNNGMGISTGRTHQILPPLSRRG